MELDRKCYECRAPKSNNDSFFCEECEAKGAVVNQFPGTNGLSDGPTSCINESVFSRPDPLNETKRMAKKMEDGGRMTKETASLFQGKISAMEKQEPTRKKMDYEKSGHPMA